jgi:hypothetical protein
VTPKKAESPCNYFMGPWDAYSGEKKSSSRSRVIILYFGFDQSLDITFCFAQSRAMTLVVAIVVPMVVHGSDKSSLQSVALRAALSSSSRPKCCKTSYELQRAGDQWLHVGVMLHGDDKAIAQISATCGLLIGTCLFL